MGHPSFICGLGFAGGMCGPPADMYISTLQSMIRAMGGRLKIEAVFPEGKVEINQFRKLRKTAGAD